MKLQDKQFHIEREYLYDHKTDGGDDAPPITPIDLRKLDRYCHFEKMFPFYKMDVNGFILHVNMAIVSTCEEKDRGQFITKISLVEL